MRICLLSSGHKPCDERIFYKEARTLAKEYDDVWVISPYSEYIPEKKDGVKFRSIPTYSRNMIGRFKSVRELYKIALNLKADIYHCHEPESLVAAIKLKNKIGCKVIFDSHEMWAASLAQRFPTFLQSYIMFIYKMFEHTKIRQCDYVIGASWTISDYLKRIVGHERTETILNCTLPDIFGEVPEKKWNEQIIICHDGHLPFSRGLKTMVKAAEIVSKKYQIKFKIVGDVFDEEREWLESYLTKYGLDDMIERTGWLDYRDVGHALANCHIGLIALQKLPNNIVTSANKEFNYMYYGMPFVSPDFRLSTNKLIAEEKCGISANSVSAKSYAEAISYLIEHHDKMIEMGLNAKKASEERYRWTHMEGKLLNVYKQLEQN